MAAADQDPASRPFTVSIVLGEPALGRTAFVVVPLDITDEELLIVTGQTATNGRKAILGKREQDAVAGMGRLIRVRRLEGLT